MSPDDLSDVLHAIGKVTEIHTYVYRALNDLRSHKTLHPELFRGEHPEGNFALISLERANETCVELLSSGAVGMFRQEALKSAVLACDGN